MLSVHVFHRPVGELKAQMPSREFDQYLAFFQYEPMPDPWMLTGTVAASMYHCHGAKNAKPSDFKARPRRQQTAMEIMAILKAKTKGRTKHG